MKRYINKIIIASIIILLILNITNSIFAAEKKGYWKKAWDNLKDTDLATDPNYWGDYPDILSKIDAMSEKDLKALDNSSWDRAAVIQFIEKYLDDNRNKTTTYKDRLNEIFKQIAKLESYYKQQGREFTEGEKNILTGGKVISSGEAIDNSNKINDINKILETGIEDGKPITDERRKELEKERDSFQEENNERDEENKNLSNKSILKKQPIGIVKAEERDGKISADETIQGAMDFINSGKDSTIDSNKLQETTMSLFNILMVIAMVVAIIVGLVIAIKFMLSSVEGKADIKQALVPYVIGCFITFGALGIWRIVIAILNNLE